jgi:hypothetical protein
MQTREEMIEVITQKMWTWNFWAWHLMSIEPVRIWDIMDYLENNNLSEYIDWVKFDDYWNLQEFDNYLIKYWKYKRLPIEEQSDETIKFVFDLLPKN